MPDVSSLRCLVPRLGCAWSRAAPCCAHAVSTMFLRQLPLLLLLIMFPWTLASIVLCPPGLPASKHTHTPPCTHPPSRNWKYAGTLFSQLSQNFSRFSTCLPPPEDRDKRPEDEEEGDGGGTVPPGSRGFGGHCDQFGRDCRMWECPDFFEVAPGVAAFKYSDQVGWVTLGYPTGFGCKGERLL